MYWNKKIETCTPTDLNKFQLSALTTTLKQASKAPYYHKHLHPLLKRKIISTLHIQDIPFTEKQHLRDHFPYGFLTVDKKDITRLHSSSGTTGIPTVVFHTRRDIDLWADLVARCMYMTGVRATDVFQNTMGYGLFTGGLGFHYGAEKIGVLTIPVGPGNSKRQIWFMQKFGTTTLHILPSYALHLNSTFEESGIDPKSLKLKIAFIGAEQHSDELRKQIEHIYDIKAYNSYGLSEMCGPGVAFECQEQNGMHLWEDHYLMEIIDPQTGQVLPDGEEGELVLTTLQRTAMPLIRYRTRDLTRIISEPCPCGRTHRRIDRIKGRSDDMLIINGVNIFPLQIEKTIMAVPGVGNNYRIEIHKEHFMDRIVVSIEVQDSFFHGKLRELEDLQKRITDDLKAECGVNPRVKLVEPESLPVAEGKAQRVIDCRNKE